MNDFKEKLYNFIKFRAVILLIIFFIINIIASLPFINHVTEILSHFKLQYFYCAVLFFIIFISFFNKKFIWGIVLSLILIFLNLFDLIPYFIRTPDVHYENSLKIGLFNVLTSNWHYTKVIQEIKNNKPDILIMQEVNDIWVEELNIIKKEYPYTIEYPLNLGNFGIALYSKFPIINFSIEDWTDYNLPVINAKIQKDENVFNIYAIHTLPPLKKDYFIRRNEMFKKINYIAQHENKNLIIAGDLNSTAFSPVYKKYIKSLPLNDAQTKKGNIHIGSWSAFYPAFLRVTLEHILTSEDIQVKSYKNGNKIGSDHFPVFAELTFPLEK